jgi:hypothetical protein
MEYLHTTIEHESKDFSRGTGVVRGGRQSPKSGKMDILNESIDYLCSTNIIEPNTRKVNKVRFLGSFTKLREATVSFVISVRPFVRMEQLGSHWRDFREI